jgi:hypothetical protein
MDEGDKMTNPALVQSNKTDGDLDGLDDRKAPPSSVPGFADETRSLRPFEPTATHGPYMGSTSHTQGSPLPTPILQLSDHD